MSTTLNEVKRNPKTGMLERTGRKEKPVYTEREGGGYEVTTQAADAPIKKGSYDASKSLAENKTNETLVRDAKMQANREEVTKQVISDLNKSAQKSRSTNKYEYNQATKEIITTRQIQQPVQQPEGTAVINKQQQIKTTEETQSNDQSGRVRETYSGSSGSPSISPLQKTQAGEYRDSVQTSNNSNNRNPLSTDGGNDRNLSLTRYEQRIKDLRERESKRAKRTEKQDQILRRVPLLAGDNFAQKTGRVLLGLPFNTVQYSTTPFERAYALGEGLIIPETRQPSQSLALQALKETPAEAARQNDPRTPEGLVNLGLAVLGVRAGRSRSAALSNEVSRVTGDLVSGTKTVRDLETGKVTDTTIVEGQLRQGDKVFDVKGGSQAETVPRAVEPGSLPSAARIERGVVTVTDPSTGREVVVPIRSDSIVRSGRKTSKSDGQYVFQVPGKKAPTTTQGAIVTETKPTGNAGEVYVTNPADVFPVKKNPKANAEVRRILEENKIQQFGFEQAQANARTQQAYMRQDGTISATTIDYGQVLASEGVRRAPFTVYQRGTRTRSALTVKDSTKQIPEGETNYFTKEPYTPPKGKEVLSKPISVETGRGEGFTLVDLDSARQVVRAPAEGLTVVKPTFRERLKGLFSKPKENINTLSETKTATVIEFDAIEFDKAGTFQSTKQGFTGDVGREFPANIKLSQGKTTSETGINKPVPQPKIKPIDTALVLEPELRPTKGYTILEGETATLGNAKGQAVKANVFTGETKGFGGPQETVQKAKPKPSPQPAPAFPQIALEAAKTAAKTLSPQPQQRTVRGPVAVASGARINAVRPQGRIQTSSATTQYYENPIPKPPITEADRIIDQKGLQDLRQSSTLANAQKTNDKQRQDQERLPSIRTDQTAAQAQKPAQDTVQEQRNVFKQQQDTARRQKPRAVIRPLDLPKIETPDRPYKLPALLPTGKNEQEGFNVKVRRKGKFKTLNSEPLSKEDAIGLGAYNVEKTLGASFKIESAGKPATGKTNTKGTLKDFYKSKREDNTFVQKANARLGRRSERQEIQSARKSRGIFG